MVKAILEKSEANEGEEVRKDDLKKEARRAARQAERKDQDGTSSDVKTKESNEDMEMMSSWRTVTVRTPTG
jgi:hypothetical protein